MAPSRWSIRASRCLRSAPPTRQRHRWPKLLTPLRRRVRAVFATSDKVRHATVLPVVRTGHPLTDPIALIATFYAMVERVAVGRGIDPDTPRHLRKVTETT